MKKAFFVIMYIIMFNIIAFSQEYRVIESTIDHLTVEYNFQNYKTKDTIIKGVNYTLIKGPKYSVRKPGEPWLPEEILTVGIPNNSTPEVSILSIETKRLENKLIVSYPEVNPFIEKADLTNFDLNIYNSNQYFPGQQVKLDNISKMRYAKIASFAIAPFQYNPVTRELSYNSKIKLKIKFNINKTGNEFVKISDPFTESFLINSVVNPDVAKNWITKEIQLSEKNFSDYNWYRNDLEYFKIYVKNKGFYRVTFDQILSSGGISSSMIPDSTIMLYNNGVQVPILVRDINKDSIFNSGDYFEFIGMPPSPGDYTKLNIFNNSNVYWFTYRTDTTALRFKFKDAYPDFFDRTMSSSLITEHFEKDTLYERLGHAPDDQRDYWYWGKASAHNYSAIEGFEHRYEQDQNLNSDSSSYWIRVDMHGITDPATTYPDHKAQIFLNSKKIGDHYWDGQQKTLFEKRLFISADTMPLYQANYLKVFVKGDSAAQVNSDEIRINWFEIDYWRHNRAVNNRVVVTNKSVHGLNRFWTWKWTTDSILVFVPQRKEVLYNFLWFNDTLGTVTFKDDSYEDTEYLCYGKDEYTYVDSIVRAKKSNLLSTGNGSDYIIITHEKFTSTAEALKNLRSISFPDSSIVNPRIKIVQVDEIYDVFSYGLLEPAALQRFVKYAFENWEAPAPSYIVIIGDMSYDYRKLLSNSRPNYVPSMVVHAATYGQAVSDNLIVSVSGADWVPDLAIGRLSIENLNEGLILIDKIKNYPTDNSKEWKQNVLLIASGLNKDDENYFRFNDASMELDRNYLLNNGISSTKIFRYPNVPEYEPYKGETVEIRRGFNNGAVIANYYGHGGGYQWDLVFLNEDIYLLENGGKLPFVSSVTCYTAHFDNQDVFGEQFLKVPNKGCIGFFGSSGLTIWGIGDYINMLFFDQVFNKKNDVVGKAILNAKVQVAGFSYYYITQIALLTYLGDPVLRLDIPHKPDFTIKSNDITINKSNILVKDSTVIKTVIKNNGTIFKNDSLSVQLYATSSDTTYLIETRKVGSFGEYDSLFTSWVPKKSGLYQITVKVNLVDSISEMDFSDNSASSSFVVYDISEPNIIKPINGFNTNQHSVEFLFSDIGYYINLGVKYYIQIDTTKNISDDRVYIMSPAIIPNEGIANWVSPVLANGEYFWRTRIYDGGKFGAWSDVKSFSVMDSVHAGYYAAGGILKMFKTYNTVYNHYTKSLDLNLALLPPRPSNATSLDTIKCSNAVLDTIGMTTITTDGTYIYFGGMSYFEYNQYNPDGLSEIHKIGTGSNGTVKGEYYGTIPNFRNQIINTIFYHSDGLIYTPTKDPYTIKSINPSNGDTALVNVPAGILRWEDSRPLPGTYYLNSDGKFVYNLTLADSNGLKLYTVRIFDPTNGWQQVGTDKKMFGTSYYNDFSSFFVADNYLYPFEKNRDGYMRRLKIEDGSFEEEWITVRPFQKLFAWCYDWGSDKIYASQYKGKNQTPKPYLLKFSGKYNDSEGKITTEAVGPANTWKKANYSMNTYNSNGNYIASLYGLNSNTKIWDTLRVNIPSSLDIDTIDAKKYSFLKMDFNLSDTTLGSSVPLKLMNVNLDYAPLPELILTKNNFSFSPDTLLQGFETFMELKIKNIGLSEAKNIKMNFFLNGEDTSFYSQLFDLPADSSKTLQDIINTTKLLPATLHRVQATAESGNSEYYTYNNLIEKNFFVARDSINPLFNITIDGKEILNGDIVSSNPEIVIELRDEGPLPIDTSYFTIVHNNIPLGFKKDNLMYNYTPYPNSKATINWKPNFKEGKHVLEILAKDASGNFFDTTSARLIFYVYNNFDIVNLLNYPNPFKNETHFTFDLRGDNKDLEDFNIKIFTVAGRLIRDLKIPISSIQSGFNKIYWDGKDEDGDEIGNGVYLYKAIIKYKGNTKTIIQKLAKVK